MGQIYKSIEQLKAHLLCIIGDLFMTFTKGSNVAKDAILRVYIKWYNSTIYIGR